MLSTIDVCSSIFWAQQSSVQHDMLPSKQLMSLRGKRAIPKQLPSKSLPDPKKNLGSVTKLGVMPCFVSCPVELTYCRGPLERLVSTVGCGCGFWSRSNSTIYESNAETLEHFHLATAPSDLLLRTMSSLISAIQQPHRMQRSHFERSLV